jgi:hypothetical protein
MEDGNVELSEYAKAALAEFYREEKEREAEYEHAKNKEKLQIENFKEEWQLSQFWVRISRFDWNLYLDLVR